MISFDDTVRLVRLQERLRNSTYHRINKGDAYKSSEGAVSITMHMPPVVGDDRDHYWSVEAWSYLLNDEGRNKSWIGKSASEAISKAEDGVKRWCMMAEMEMFEKSAGIEQDPYFDKVNPPPHDEILG